MRDGKRSQVAEQGSVIVKGGSSKEVAAYSTALQAICISGVARPVTRSFVQVFPPVTDMERVARGYTPSNGGNVMARKTSNRDLPEKHIDASKVENKECETLEDELKALAFFLQPFKEGWDAPGMEAYDNL